MEAVDLRIHRFHSTATVNGKTLTLQGKAPATAAYAHATASGSQGLATERESEPAEPTQDSKEAKHSTNSSEDADNQSKRAAALLHTCQQEIDERISVAVRLGTRSIKLYAPCAQARFAVVVFQRRGGLHRSAIATLKPEVFARQRGL